MIIFQRVLEKDGGEEEREKDGVASGDGREVRGYIYGILGSV